MVPILVSKLNSKLYSPIFPPIFFIIKSPVESGEIEGGYSTNKSFTWTDNTHPPDMAIFCQ